MVIRANTKSLRPVCDISYVPLTKALRLAFVIETERIKSVVENQSKCKKKTPFTKARKLSRIV